MSNSVPSATPVHSTDDESIWGRGAVMDKMRSAPEHGRITDEYDVTSVILGVLYEGMMDLPEDEYRPYPEACVEFLQDKASKKALQNAFASGDYREVMSFPTLLDDSIDQQAVPDVSG